MRRRAAARGETERDGRMAIVEELEALREQTLAQIAQAADTAALEQVRIGVLGKAGTLTGYLRQMGQIAKEERAAVGKTANEVRAGGGGGAGRAQGGWLDPSWPPPSTRPPWT